MEDRERDLEEDYEVREYLEQTRADNIPSSSFITSSALQSYLDREQGGGGNKGSPFQGNKRKKSRRRAMAEGGSARAEAYYLKGLDATTKQKLFLC